MVRDMYINLILNSMYIVNTRNLMSFKCINTLKTYIL